ncbi:hypothetical protein CWI38_0088p0050 [Hamiltosporidium tvaerminnensis]|uniref:Uncharacterized protein n=1 Tax=Hamiltosporidium tvaerminnensis TaxID=1176355 RepID=A0A4Q9M0Z6_9MICR|nr:hypothetical protein CWI38_0088p0050 [Hamiltosporidium tvaerminnensis]
MLSENIKPPRDHNLPRFLTISRSRQSRWYKSWYIKTKKFFFQHLFFVVYVMIDLMIVCTLEIIYKEYIQVRILFFVALVHVYQRVYFPAIDFHFYSHLIPKDRYMLILRIGMLFTYFIQSLSRFSTENEFLINLRIYNRLYAAILGNLWSLSSFLIFYFTMKFFPNFLIEFRNSQKILIAALIALIFFFLVHQYELTYLLANIFVNFDFMALLPSYIIVGLIIYIDPEISDENHNTLYDIFYSLIYASMQWPFLVNILKNIYSNLIFRSKT